ncbi:hypothetical protein HCH_02249 [Hahella chejuensis KCTC 2396]|uniref:PEP-CTERM sorting domain-containing protein n=1 Tax=Hahella chejuensis (strain KCTC 2396) TaxID=349521 RepID=Q2SJU9_HAHCH|nr:hypothetical protein [Hahella chejuensis]ABC29075.1 hypothetical protein HCH_02249 [Hahella chejuensis KCTC 2396]
MKHPQPVLALCCLTLSAAAMAMEAMTDEELGQVDGRSGFSFAFDNVRFKGMAIDGAEAGSINIIAADGSSLGLKEFQLSADAIGTFESPLTFSLVEMDGSLVNNSSSGLPMLRIGLPGMEGWRNLDVRFNEEFGNPDVPNPDNPNIRAGGTPSEHTMLGSVSMNDISILGGVAYSGIPEGYKIESVRVDDGSSGADSRQGMLLNVDINELLIPEWLVESQVGDGVLNPATDFILYNFRLENLHLQSATFEAAPNGLRFAYSDPQPFTEDGGIIPSGGGLPDTQHPDYDPNFPKIDLTFQAQMTQSKLNESRIHGVTLDHLIFNVRN